MSKAILRTLCGMERVVDCPPGAMGFRVPLFARLPRVAVGSPDDPMPVKVRCYDWYGEEKDGVRVFVENGGSEAAPPRADSMVPLTAGEWADAVARAYRPSMAEADRDFLRRHDGATVIGHKSGALIGVFYMAPSWDHSNEMVALFSQLRALFYGDK